MPFFQRTVEAAGYTVVFQSAENDPSTLRYIYEFPAQFNALLDKSKKLVVQRMNRDDRP